MTILRVEWVWGCSVALASVAQFLAGSVLWADPVSPSDVLIVDMHCHAAGIGAGNSGCFVSDGLRKSWKYTTYLRAFGVTEDELLEHGDGLTIKRLSERIEESRYVDAAVILAIDGVVDDDGNLDVSRTQIYVPNDFVHAETMKYPNLYYGASVNPYRTDAIQILVREARRGAKLVKWLPNIQMIDPADPALTAFYTKMRELGLPLLSHTGRESAFMHSKDEYGDPMRLRLPLELGVTVIAAHAACLGKTDGERNMDRFLALAKDFPNLYADISAMTQINYWSGLRKLLRQRHVIPRLLYGADMPLPMTMLVSPWYSFFSIGPMNVFRLLKEKNVWDRDVVYKKKLGVPDEVFSRPAILLKLKPYHG